MVGLVVGFGLVVGGWWLVVGGWLVVFTPPEKLHKRPLNDGPISKGKAKVFQPLYFLGLVFLGKGIWVLPKSVEHEWIWVWDSNRVPLSIPIHFTGGMCEIQTTN